MFTLGSHGKPKLKSVTFPWLLREQHMPKLSMWAELFAFAERVSEWELCRLDFPNKSRELETAVVIILPNNSCSRALEQKHLRALRTCQPSPGLFTFVSACDNAEKFCCRQHRQAQAMAYSRLDKCQMKRTARQRAYSKRIQQSV